MADSDRLGAPFVVEQWFVRAQFGIEVAGGKMNGGRTLWELPHMSIADAERRRSPA
jgi:hypothetical protein